MIFNFDPNSDPCSAPGTTSLPSDLITVLITITKIIALLMIVFSRSRLRIELLHSKDRIRFARSTLSCGLTERRSTERMFARRAKGLSSGTGIFGNRLSRENPASQENRQENAD